jgi:hypothetical protein
MIYRPNKSKPLILIIIILLLANIGGLFFFFKNKAYKHDEKPPMDRRQMIGKYLKDELKFNAAQLKSFDSLSDQHKQVTNPLFDSLKDEKEKRLRFLSDNNYSDSALEQVVTRSAERQKNLDLKMLEHIRNIRLLCDEAQKQSFDTGFYKMLRRNRPDKKTKQTKQ